MIVLISVTNQYCYFWMRDFIHAPTNGKDATNKYIHILEECNQVRTCYRIPQLRDFCNLRIPWPQPMKRVKSIPKNKLFTYLEELEWWELL
jgi:hypothetical protein